MAKREDEGTEEICETENIHLIIYSNAKLFGERQRDALFDTHRQFPALRFRDYRQHFYHNAEKLEGDLTFCKNILTFAPNISVLCT